MNNLVYYYTSNYKIICCTNDERKTCKPPFQTLASRSYSWERHFLQRNARLLRWQIVVGVFRNKNGIRTQIAQTSCCCWLIVAMSFSLLKGKDDGEELYNLRLNFIGLLSLSCTTLYWRVALAAILRVASWLFFSIWSRCCYVKFGVVESGDGVDHASAIGAFGCS